MMEQIKGVRRRDISPFADVMEWVNSNDDLKVLLNLKSPRILFIEA